MERTEPVTPIGSAYLQPNLNHVTYCIVGLKNPIDIEALKNEMLSPLLMKAPRFSSIAVHNPHDGSQHWEKTNVNLDDHIVIHDDDDDDHNHHDENMSQDDIINSYMADMAISSSSSMRMDKPLWDIHILQKHNCMIVRAHHALADGMSLLSAAWSISSSSSSKEGGHGHHHHHHHHHDGHDVGIMSKKNGDHGGHHDDGDDNKKGTSRRFQRRGTLWESLVFIWFSLIFGFKFLLRCLWVKDESKVISGIDGVELWPRKIATARFKLADMKAIKMAIPNATINDVLYGILSQGLTKYLNIEYPKALRDGAQITGICPVNLRPRHGLEDVSKMAFGNKFAMILMPIRYMTRQYLDPLTYILNAKKVMDRKKLSMEATFSYNVMRLGAKLFGSKVGGKLFYNIFHNTTFLISNVIGPQEEISIAGSPVTYLRASSSSQPQAITMHMVSYAGMADLQIQVAKEVISDPKYLAKCFEDALLEMKEAAHQRQTISK